jgi:hypothetical protein
MSIFSMQSAAEAPDATVAANGYRLQTTTSMVPGRGAEREGLQVGKAKAGCAARAPMLCVLSAAMCAASPRLARMPPCTAGCSVFTRPSSISGKEVSSCEGAVPGASVRVRTDAAALRALRARARLHLLHRHAGGSQRGGAAARGDQVEAERNQPLRRSPAAARGGVSALPRARAAAIARARRVRCAAPRALPSSIRPVLSKTEMSARGLALPAAAACARRVSGA